MSPTLLFTRMRCHLLRNSVSTLFHGAFVRLATILFCSILIWGLLFGVSYYGFHELKTLWEIPLDLNVIELAFDMLFMTLTILLTFSTCIILYSSLFASDESTFLLTTPIPDDHVFAYKFQGAMGFSSWAFLLLASPILISYGMLLNDGAPWYFYLLMPVFFLGFVLVPGSLGAIFCLVLVAVVPRQRKQILLLAIVLLVLFFLSWAISWLRYAASMGMFNREWFEAFLDELNLFRSRWVPFHWIVLGLKYAALGELDQSAYYLALIWSNGLMLYLGATWLASKLYRFDLNRVRSGGNLRKKYGNTWLDAVITRMLFFLDDPTRWLIVKDFRTFRRDPAQWAQILIFMIMGSLYFFFMRRFYESDVGRGFKNGISILTLTSTAFLMCAYTGRFIFPMLSLEGRKFWILGLLPLERSQLLWGKFAFSATGCVLAGEFLVVVSNLMLGMPWFVVLMHAFAVFVMAMGLSGFSVGLGACLPNFRETDPSKIAIGFGGTLNLVAGLLFLLVVILFMVAPVHIFLATRGGTSAFVFDLPWWIGLLHVVGGVLGLACTRWILRLGVRQLSAMEF